MWRYWLTCAPPIHTNQSIMLLVSRVCCLSALACNVPWGKWVTLGIDSPLRWSTRLGDRVRHGGLCERRCCVWRSIFGFEGTFSQPAAELRLTQPAHKTFALAKKMHAAGFRSYLLRFALPHWSRVIIIKSTSLNGF